MPMLLRLETPRSARHYGRTNGKLGVTNLCSSGSGDSLGGLVDDEGHLKANFMRPNVDSRVRPFPARTVA